MGEDERGLCVPLLAECGLAQLVSSPELRTSSDAKVLGPTSCFISHNGLSMPPLEMGVLFQGNQGIERLICLPVASWEWGRWSGLI